MKRHRPKKAKEAKKTSRKRRLVLLILFLIVAALPLIAFNKWASEPSSQTIVIDNRGLKTDTPPKFQTLKTDYYSVAVPTGWRIVKEADQNTPGRLQVLTYATTGSSQAAITTGVLPDEGLSGVGDYNLRATDAAHYTNANATSLPSGSRLFKNASGPVELTVFMIHDNRYASLTTSGQDTSDQSLSLLSTMSNSLHWNQ